MVSNEQFNFISFPKLPTPFDIESSFTWPESPQPIVTERVEKPVRKSGKRRWSKLEDKRLKELVSQSGVENWRRFEQEFEGRAAKSLRERYIQHLRPGINKKPFSAEERSQVIAFQAIHGNKWSELNKQMPDRTTTQIRNFWHSNCRKKNGAFTN